MSHIQTAGPSVQNCALQMSEPCSGTALSSALPVPGDFLELRRRFTRKQSGMVLMNGIKDSGSGNHNKKGSLLILMKFQEAKCCNKE